MKSSRVTLKGLREELEKTPPDFQHVCDLLTIAIVPGNVLRTTEWKGLRFHGIVDRLLDLVVASESLSSLKAKGEIHAAKSQITLILVILVQLHMDNLFRDDMPNFKNKAQPFLREAFEALKLKIFKLSDGTSEFAYIMEAHLRLMYLMGAWAHYWKEDRDVMMWLPMDDICRLFYDVTFDRKLYNKPASHVSNAKAFRAVYEAVAPYVHGDDHVYKEVREKAVSKFGAKVISRRFLEAFKDEELCKENSLFDQMKILQIFSHSQGLRKQFKMDSTYSAILHAVWVGLRDDSAERIWLVDHLPGWGLNVISYMVVGRDYLTEDETLDNGSPDIRETLEELVRRDDLLLLAAKGLLVNGRFIPSKVDSEQVQEVFEAMAVMCCPTQDLKLLVRTQWLQVLDGFLAIRRSVDESQTEKCENAIKIWRNIGSWLRCDETKVRKMDRAVKTRTAGISTIGCGWYKCPLSGCDLVPSGRRMMLCTCCKRVQYCSIRCQERDWKEGRHKKQCMSLLLESRPARFSWDGLGLEPGRHHGACYTTCDCE